MTIKWRFFLRNNIKTEEAGISDNIIFSTNDLEVDDYIKQFIRELNGFIELEENGVKVYINVSSIQLALRTESEQGITSEDQTDQEIKA